MKNEILQHRIAKNIKSFGLNKSEAKEIAELVIEESNKTGEEVSFYIDYVLKLKYGFNSERVQRLFS